MFHYLLCHASNILSSKITPKLVCAIVNKHYFTNYLTLYHSVMILISVCFCLLLFHGRKWFIAHSQSESVDKRVDNEHRLSITSLFTPSLQQEKSILNREIENIKDLTTNFLSSLFFFFPMRKIFCTRLD